MDAYPNTTPCDARSPLTSCNRGPASTASITLILPAYNEQEVIEQAICEADDALAGLTSDYEILVVDDGSWDETAAIAERVASQRRSVRILRQPRNLGYGAALASGFQAASKQLVAFTDADCQFDVRELDRLVMLARDYEIVCGYRIDRQDPLHRKLYSQCYNSLVRLLLGTGVRDCDCALKLFRREVIQSMEIDTKRFFVNAEILTKARLQGVSIVEVGVTHRPRPRGCSTVSALHAFPVATALLRFWWSTVLFPGVRVESRESSERWPVRWQGAAGLLLLLASVMLLVTNLSYPLIEPDETRYAQIAIEMSESADWITPTLDGKPYLDKPPLLYWLTAASYQVFGRNETAARLPCALAAVLTILSTYWLGGRLVGHRGAWCGAFALLLCGGFVLSGRFLIMDGLLTLFTTSALFAGYLALSGERLRLGWWLAAGAACALGVLTKGPVALVICIPPLLVYRWLAGSSFRLRPRDWLAIAAPVVVLTLPWFIAISRSQPDFWGYFLGKHHVMRFVSAFNHQEPWWFYLPVIFIGMFPASLLLPGLAAFLFNRTPAGCQSRSRDLGFLLLSAIWTVGFFSVSSCKLPTYILPALPPLCLLLGSMLAQSIVQLQPGGGVARLLQPIPQRAAVSILAIAAIGAVVDLVIFKAAACGPLLDVVVVLAAGLMLIVVWRTRLMQATRAWAYAGTIALMVMMMAFNGFVPEFSRRRSIHVAAAHLHLQHHQAPVVYIGQSSHSASFHLQPGELVTLDADQFGQVQELLAKRPEAVVVASAAVADKLKGDLRSSIQIAPAGGRGRIYLTSRRPSPRVHVSGKGQPVLR
ncbi:MAG: glycosyltransferase [Planctomycetes bacterium]|nr:glycosyltransferase [Planctomycetota bacterium]